MIPATLLSLVVTVVPSAETTWTSVGWGQQCSSLGQFVGPLVVASVMHALGGWQWAWIATVSFAILGLLIAWRLSRLGLPNAC